MRDRNDVRGFTLLELLISVAVIAVLVLTSRVGYRRMLTKSRRGEAKTNLAQIKMMMDTYATDSARGYQVDDVGLYWGFSRCSVKPKWVQQIGFDLGNCRDSNYSYTISNSSLDEFDAVASSGEVGPNRVCSWVAAGPSAPLSADRFTVDETGIVIHENDCIESR